jgi:hypothetical protein
MINKSKSSFKLGYSRRLDTFNSEFIRLSMLHLLVGRKSDHRTTKNFHKHNIYTQKKLSWSEGIRCLKTFQLNIQTHVHAHTLQLAQQQNHLSVVVLSVPCLQWRPSPAEMDTVLGQMTNYCCY